MWDGYFFIGILIYYGVYDQDLEDEVFKCNLNVVKLETHAQNNKPRVNSKSNILNKRYIDEAIDGRIWI